MWSRSKWTRCRWTPSKWPRRKWTQCTTRLAAGPVLAAFLGSSPCPAEPVRERILAILPIRMLDTSGEPRDQTADHAARLSAMADGLSARLEAGGAFRVVGIGADALARACPDQAPACILATARDTKAGLAFVGVIHKSSTLIMQMFARIVETGSGATLFSRELNFRGDNDEAWRRAEAFLVREIDADPATGPSAKK